MFSLVLLTITRHPGSSSGLKGVSVSDSGNVMIGGKVGLDKSFSKRIVDAKSGFALSFVEVSSKTSSRRHGHGHGHGQESHQGHGHGHKLHQHAHHSHAHGHHASKQGHHHSHGHGHHGHRHGHHHEHGQGHDLEHNHEHNHEHSKVEKVEKVDAYETQDFAVMSNADLEKEIAKEFNAVSDSRDGVKKDTVKGLKDAAKDIAIRAKGDKVNVDLALDAVLSDQKDLESTLNREAQEDGTHNLDGLKKAEQAVKTSLQDYTSMREKKKEIDRLAKEGTREQLQLTDLNSVLMSTQVDAAVQETQSQANELTALKNEMSKLGVGFQALQGLEGLKIGSSVSSGSNSNSTHAVGGYNSSQLLEEKLKEASRPNSLIFPEENLHETVILDGNENGTILQGNYSSHPHLPHRRRKGKNRNTNAVLERTPMLSVTSDEMGNSYFQSVLEGSKKDGGEKRGENQRVKIEEKKEDAKTVKKQDATKELSNEYQFQGKMPDSVKNEMQKKEMQNEIMQKKDQNDQKDQKKDQSTPQQQQIDAQLSNAQNSENPQHTAPNPVLQAFLNSPNSANNLHQNLLPSDQSTSIIQNLYSECFGVNKLFGFKLSQSLLEGNASKALSGSWTAWFFAMLFWIAGLACVFVCYGWGAKQGGFTPGVNTPFFPFPAFLALFIYGCVNLFTITKTFVQSRELHLSIAILWNGAAALLTPVSAIMPMNNNTGSFLTHLIPNQF